MTRLIRLRVLGATTLILTGLIVYVGGDAVFDLAVDLGETLIELVEEGLETFFRKAVGLDLRGAQMATAYTGFTLVLIVGGLMLRSMCRLTYRIAAGLWSWWREHWAVFESACQAKVIFLQAWWHSLDRLNRTAVVVGSTLVFVPLALLLSFGLGMAVAEFL